MNENKRQEILNNMPSIDEIYSLAELFKIFGDSTRTSILSALEASELCVSEIAEVLNLSISAVSHQLRILKNAKLVKFRKNGKDVYYSLDDDHVKKIIDCGLSHINEED